jgi:hypothetical protein
VRRADHNTTHYVVFSIHITLSLGPNILFSTLFSNIRSLHSSLNVTDQVSCPYNCISSCSYLIITYIKSLWHSVNLKGLVRNNLQSTVRWCLVICLAEMWKTMKSSCREKWCPCWGLKQTSYLRLESLTALAVSEARSNTPTIGFVNVPTSPFPKPEIRPYKKTYTVRLQQLWSWSIESTVIMLGTVKCQVFFRSVVIYRLA